jgi:hypothetical protein
LYLGGTATEVKWFRIDVDGEGIHVRLEVAIPRHSSWDSADATYDGVGAVWPVRERTSTEGVDRLVIAQTAGRKRWSILNLRREL